MRSIEGRVQRLKRQVFAGPDQKGILNALLAHFLLSVSAVISESEFDFLKCEREIPSTPAYRAAHRLVRAYLLEHGLARALAGANFESRDSFAPPADEAWPGCPSISALLGRPAPLAPPFAGEEEEPEAPRHPGRAAEGAEPARRRRAHRAEGGPQEGDGGSAPGRAGFPARSGGRPSPRPRASPLAAFSAEEEDFLARAEPRALHAPESGRVSPARVLGGERPHRRSVPAGGLLLRCPALQSVRR
jgi:hypothetical protein